MLSVSLFPTFIGIDINYVKKKLIININTKCGESGEDWIGRRPKHKKNEILNKFCKYSKKKKKEKKKKFKKIS